MDRDRGGFDERGVVETQVRRQRDQLLGAYVPEALQGPGVSTPLTLRLWQRCSFPARHAGQVPSQVSGMTVT